MGNSVNIYLNGKYFDFDLEVKKCKQISFGVVTYLDLIGQSISKSDTLFIYEKLKKSKPYVREDIRKNNYNLQKDFGKELYDYEDIEIQKGKSIFLHFAFAKCPPCRKEIPIIEELYLKHKDHFEFIVITPDKDITELKSLFKENITIYQLLDVDIDYRFGISQYPQTMIFSKEKKLKFHLNQIQEDFIESYLYKIIFY